MVVDVVVDVEVDVDVDVLVDVLAVLEVLESGEPEPSPHPARTATGTHISTAERRTNVVMVEARTRAHHR